MTNTRTTLDKAMTEDELLQAITEAATWNGWLVYHVRRSDKALQQGNAGFPDLVLVKDSRCLFLELKSERGRVSAAQERWLRRLKVATLVHSSVIRPSDLNMVLMWLRS